MAPFADVLLFHTQKKSIVKASTASAVLFRLVLWDAPQPSALQRDMGNVGTQHHSNFLSSEDSVR